MTIETQRLGIITVAVGEKHLGLAKNLASSFLCFNKIKDIGFTILTDKPVEPDTFLEPKGIRHICSNALCHANENVLLNKVVAPALSPYDVTIMLDADCLVCGSLMPVFEMLSGYDLSVVGEPIASGRWHADVEALLKHFDIPRLYKFIGSFYYFSSRAVAEKVTARALSLASEYDSLQIDRIHHRFLNEEVLMSVSLASFSHEVSLKIIPEASPLKGETMIYSIRNINLLSGRSELGMSSNCMPREVLGGMLPENKLPLIIAFDSDSRRHLDYSLNVMQARVFLALCDAPGRPASLKPLLAMIRICWVVFSVVALDVFNSLKSLKLVVGRIFFFTRQQSMIAVL